MRKIILLFVIFVNTIHLSAQDTIVKDNMVNKDRLTYKKFIIPVSLIGIGAILKSPKIQTSVQNRAGQFFGPNFELTIDDYFQFVPLAQEYLGNSIGFESKNGYKQMITNDLVSKAMIIGSVVVIKNNLRELRPDGVGHRAFPSGHTAMAFGNATALFLEYKDNNIWYASSGYLFATATGILRVANNRHWSGDVFVGAGLGIGITTLVHYWSPFNFDKKNKNIGLIGYPIINDKNYGIGLVYQIK
jgi:membrane-associated phospholipid phosphatase